MSTVMKLDDCIKCEYHISYRDGAVMCKYWKRDEQRMTQILDSSIVLINCPKTENVRGSA